MMDDKVTEILSKPEPEYYTVPAHSVIANGSAKRPEGMEFPRWWKTRRNANLALKARLKHGPNAMVMINLKTMSVVTMREKFIRENESLAPLETVPEVNKPKRKRLPKAVKYARRI
jgi:hypothetical protein